jgi:iron complex transport system ATP-binding protein
MTPFLQLDHASVVRNDRYLLKDISLEISLDENVVLLGHNGAGKSTLVKLLSGDIYPLHQPRPAIRLFGEEHWDLFALRSKLAVVSPSIQEQYLDHPYCSGLEAILSGLFGSIGLYQNHKVTPEQEKQALSIGKRLGLAHLAEQEIGTMSTGEFRRLLIGRALINDPQVIVLDEPTVSLDVKARAQFLTNIRDLARNRHTIILVTHMLEEVIPEINRVIVLKDGQIFADGPKTEILNERTLSSAFDISLKVEEHNGYYYIKT